MPLVDTIETFQMTNVGDHIDGTDVYQSNDNLLDNWYFVGGGSQLGDGIFPINQRGLTSYSSAQVTIDRWTLFGGSVVLASDGITVTSSPDFGQVFEPSRLPVGTYTASVLTAAGVLGSLTFTTTGSQYFAGGALGDTGVTLNFIDLWTPTSSLFSLQCQGVKIAAVKLEKGTVSTLANDVPPDFGEALRKCQQYLWVGDFDTNTTIATGGSFSADTVVADLVLPVSMRKTNAYIVSAAGSGALIGNGTLTGVTAYSVARVVDNHAKLFLTTSGLTAYNTYSLIVTSASLKLTISAEL